MTFGYGKEINSFGKDIEETISLLSETDPAIGEAADATGMSRADLAKTLLNKYASGLQQVLSDDAIQTRALMRGSAALFAATNNLYSIKSTQTHPCLLYTSPSPRDRQKSRMPSSA